MAVQSGLPDCVLPESPCPGHPTVRSEPDSNRTSTIFMPRRAGARPNAVAAAAPLLRQQGGSATAAMAFH